LSTHTPDNVEAIYPLSPIQRGMLFHSMLEPRSGVYVPQSIIELQGALDLDAFAGAWDAVVARHAALRTIFLRLTTPEPLQVVLKSARLPLTVEDWRNTPDRERALEQQAYVDWTTPFQFGRLPLMRLRVLRWSEDVHRLVWTHHHALSDGWSSPILFRELLFLYSSRRQGRPAGLPAAPPYRNYIRWLMAQDLEKAGNYWAESLRDFPGASVPPEARPAQLDAGRAGAKNEFEWAATDGLAEGLRTLAGNWGITLSVLIQSLWGLLLGRLNHTNRVAIGVTLAGRPAELEGVERIVGTFINSVPVVLQFEPGRSLQEWLQHNQREQALRDRQGFLSLVEIKKAAGLSGDAPLFETLVVFENFPEQRGDEDSTGGLAARVLYSVSQNSYPLSLVVFPDRGLHIKYKFDAERISLPAVERLARGFATLLASCLAPQARTIGDLRIVAEAEIESRLKSGRRRLGSGSAGSVPELFAEQVRRSPATAALQWNKGEESYAELDMAANRLARYLREVGAEPDSGVGVMLSRSVSQVRSVLGVLKAGCWYVPLEPTTPPARVAAMLGDAGVRVLISTRDQVASVLQSGWEGELILLDRDAEEIARQSGEPLRIAIDAAQKAYVIYTSGSTGKPKGVAVTHGSVCNYAGAVSQRLGLPSSGSMAALSSVAADLGYTALYGALLSGRTLRLLDETLSLDAAALAAELQRAPLTALKIVPSHLRALLAAQPGGWLPAVLILGGERLEHGLIDAIRASRADCRIFNHYGPTETTVGVLCAEVSALTAESADVSLGEPLAGVEVQVLDELLQPVGEGAVGELYIGGQCLATGYLASPAQTAQRFVPHPYAKGARLYRSGDRVRVGAGGSLYFVGRADDQVKVRGYRVELNEIAQVMRAAPGITDAAVLVHEQRLHGFVTGDSQALAAYLQEQLPAHMRPESLRLLAKLPLNSNGKVDRAALRKLAEQPAEGAAAQYRAPRDEIEKQLAQIWSELLKRPRVGVDENFFDSGGNSLLLIQAHTAITQRFGKQVAIVDLFRYPTLEKLAQFLREAEPKPAQEADHAALNARQRAAQAARRQQHLQRRQG
jgi:amino acid adenylation domain-containing protein